MDTAQAGRKIVDAHTKAFNAIVQIAPTINQALLANILQNYKDELAMAMADYTIATYERTRSNGG